MGVGAKSGCRTVSLQIPRQGVDAAQGASAKEFLWSSCPCSRSRGRLGSVGRGGASGNPVGKQQERKLAAAGGGGRGKGGRKLRRTTNHEGASHEQRDERWELLPRCAGGDAVGDGGRGGGGGGWSGGAGPARSGGVGLREGAEEGREGWSGLAELAIGAAVTEGWDGSWEWCRRK